MNKAILNFKSVWEQILYHNYFLLVICEDTYYYSIIIFFTVLTMMWPLIVKLLYYILWFYIAKTQLLPSDVEKMPQISEHYVIKLKLIDLFIAHLVYNTYIKVLYTYSLFLKYLPKYVLHWKNREKNWFVIFFHEIRLCIYSYFL